MDQHSSIHTKRKEEITRTAVIAKGSLFLIIGLAILLRQIPETRYLVPDWLFGVHTLLIMLGIYNGIKHSFRNIAWLVLIIIGFLLGLDEFDAMSRGSIILYGLPVGLITLGLFIIFNKRQYGK